jgi:transcriptional regulator with XRE-family HTH domain
MTDPTIPVAGTIARWRRHERLTAVHVSRAGGISAAALRRIETGRTSRPKPATLERIPVGLATDPYTGELDRALVQRIAEDLRRAIASGVPTGPAPDCHGPSTWCWSGSGGFCSKRAAGRVATA